MPGSRMFVRAGSTVSAEDLIKGLLIPSGNDAAVALAEHLAGSEAAFVARMNDEARAGFKQQPVLTSAACTVRAVTARAISTRRRRC